jgi:cell division septation protein DedD
MFRWEFLATLLLPCATTLTSAQATITAPAVDPVFARAQALVSDGNGTAGRALVDSVLKATPPYAPMYPQALFWRASLAASAADAESDYKHIVVDYPLAPQAEDALLRLAQLELARGDRDGALSHLQRIPRDYPRSKSLARANYWTARVLFEKNDIVNACLANVNALSETGPDEIELRNQIQYQGQRCPVARESAESKVTTRDSATAAAAANSTTSSPTAQRLGDSAKTETDTSKASEVPRAPAEARDTKPSIVEPSKSVRVVRDSTAEAKTAPVPRGKYSVQVAAYNRRQDAEKLATTLARRGYQARVDGSAAPFRVRIGLYSTSAEAEDALKKIKAKHMDGFVVRAIER